MYKIVCNNLVVDVLEKVKWVRFLRKFNDAVLTDATSADGFYGSDNKTIYRLEGRYCPPGKTYRLGVLVQINRQEFDYLKSQLTSSKSRGLDVDQLNKVRASKIQELSTACNKSIVGGVKIKLSDGLYHAFALTLEDQSNIKSLYSEIQNGAERAIYHEDGKLCQYYSASDIKLLFDAMQSHIKYHTTYFNLLKMSVLEMADLSIIQGLYYGVSLSSLGLSGELVDFLEDTKNG